MHLFVDENIGQSSRSTTLKFALPTSTTGTSITVTQAAPTASADYHYKLPVVFHVIYSDRNDSTQYVSQSHLKKLIGYINKVYQNCGVNTNLEFILATEDPNGSKMSEPGVDRQYLATSKIDCEKFMGNQESNPYLNMVWNLNKYVNIMLYTFTNSNILGISSLPYTISSDTLVGLTKLPYYVQQSQIPIPLCVSINNTYIYQHSENGYTSVDVVTSLAHELGHYLGLRHTFSESDDGETNLCYDSDYCTDTPTYNYEDYTKTESDYINTHGTTLTQAGFDYLTRRTNCEDNSTFQSTNIMDYGVGLFDAFTAQQLARIRYVLTNCAYVPGPKKRTWPTSSTRTETSFHFPVQIMK
jgi:zinc-dependent metalloproteinase lipoprotein